jgi:hypothetical protein
MATDQEIRDAGFKYIPQQKYLLNPFEIPTTDDESEDGGGGGGIPYTNVSNNMGYYPGPTNTLISDYEKIIDDRQKRLFDAYDNPSTARVFGVPAFRQDVNPVDAGEYLAAGERIPFERTGFGKMFQPQSAQEIMEQGYEPRTNIGILSAILGKADKFGTLPRPDQAFITSQMGYTGPTVFGENTSGLSKDPFGLNVRSGFGNYAERVGVESQKLGDLLGKKQTDKYGKDTSGISFNFDTLTFEADDLTDQAAIDAALKATKMNKMNIAKYKYYTGKTAERNEFKEQEEARQEAAFQAQLNQQQRDQRQQDLSTIEEANRAFRAGDDSAYSSGAAGIQRDSSGAEVGYNDPFDPGGGEKDGGFIDGTNRRPFFYGGLASIL